jgi:hypothetical protein
MGGVGIADQLHSYYPTQQRASRNWFPYFFWLLDTSIINAYQIQRILHPELRKKKAHHEWFRIELARRLIMTGIKENLDTVLALKATQASTVKPTPLGAYRPMHVMSKNATRPVPINYPPPASHEVESRPTQNGCILRRWNRKLNPSLKVRYSLSGCKQCNVALCSICFRIYHCA